MYLLPTKKTLSKFKRKKGMEVGWLRGSLKRQDERRKQKFKATVMNKLVGVC